MVPRPRSRRRLPLGVLASLLFAACAALAASYGLRSPAAAPSDAPATEFSSGRAAEHVFRVAREPHPLGSPENARAREYILGELESLGLDPRTQMVAVVDERFGSPYDAATVVNVLARIEGTGGGDRAVMLSAHHDSVPTGPGANDDGAGVATLLETARALSSGPRPENDVVLLFTDGEELGLLGAKAFAEEHPWAKDVALALNFEARGSGGPSVMFETSTQNARIVEGFARAAPRHLVASSATYEVYNRLPFGSDMVEFKEAGMAGLGFSYFRGAARYHTALDAPESVNERSLQHHGSYALALARHFGDADLEGAGLEAGDGDAVYFDVLGLFLVRYPASWAPAFAVLAAALFAGVVLVGLSRGLLTIRGILGGFLASLLALVLVPAVVAALLPLLRLLGGGRPVEVSVGDVYHGEVYSLGLLAAALALTIAIYGFAVARVGARNGALGALLPWPVLSVLSAVLAPGISFLFTWPPLLALAGLAAPLLLTAAPRGSGASHARAALLLLCGTAAIALFAPSVYLLHLALTVGGAAATAAFVVLGVGLLAGHVSLVGTEDGGRRRAPRWASVGLALAALGLFAAGELLSGFDAEHPRPDTVFYALDGDSGRTRWATLDDETDAYTSRFVEPDAEEGSLGDFLPFGPPGLLDEAPPLPLAAPNVEVIENETRGDARTLRVRVSSPRGAENLSLWLESDDPEKPDAPVVSAEVDGEPVEEAENPGWGRWALEYHGLPEDGIELMLELKPEAPVRLRVVDHSAGLPDAPGVDEARPPDTMPDNDLPTTTRFADATFVGKSFEPTVPERLE